MQCIDSISGCGNTLLRLRLVQATGLLSDFFIFGARQSPAVQQARQGFQAAVADGPIPKYIVVTEGLHLQPEYAANWSKLRTWPWFADWLGSNYILVLTRTPTRPALWWARPAMPAAYRIYVRNSSAAAAGNLLARKAGLAGLSAPLLLNEP